MNYGAIKKYDIANGEGVRVSLFVSGCRRHCKGCFNEETWNFDYGEEFTSHKFFELLKALDKPYISGLSILGGEPLEPENVDEVGSLVRMFRTAFGCTKTIWLYTGFQFDEIKHLDFIELVDVIVDGPFVEDLKDISLNFRGSSNQRVLDVKKSLAADEPVLWTQG